MNIRRSAWMALCCLPVLWALASGFGRDPHAVPSVLVGKPAPEFRLMSLDGKVVSLSQLRGKPVLLNFWATWCYPCQAEHALLQATAKRLGERAVVLGMLYQNESDEAREYLRKHPSPYEHLIDPDSSSAIDYGVAGVPESFVIDGNGVIRYKHAGVLTPEVIAQQLVPLLPPPAAAATERSP